MTALFVDASALLRRYVADRERPRVLATMEAAEHWVVSALARSEIELALAEVAAGPVTLDDTWDTIGRDWDHMWEIPVDGRCLRRATTLGTRFGLGLTEAIPLAAADRLARPVSYLTLSPAQTAAADALGFEVA